MLKKIYAFLESNSIQFKKVHHEETLTAEESAKVRGEELSIGGNAFLMKVGEDFILFVISAALRLDSKKIKKHFKTKKIRFATPEELIELTGLKPGSIPPFGRPLFELDIYIDESITKNDKIAFNAGSLTDSITMDVKDYLAISNGKVIDFAKE